MSASMCKVRPDGDPLLSYPEALSRIDQSAREAADSLRRRDRNHQDNSKALDAIDSRVKAGAVTVLPLLDAAGCISANTVYAPKSTPEHDTSAMDGFAVCSQKTMQASQIEPAIFAVVGCVAAGDIETTASTSDCSAEICVEIMTGARFPESAHPSLDAVVKVEDVIIVEQWCSKQSSVKRYIQVTRPVKSMQHRRPAGSDFSKGDIIVDKDTVILPKHIAALASLGTASIAVHGSSSDVAATPYCEKHTVGLRIGILSTGSEIVAADVVGIPREGQQIADSNGPYLVSALRMILPHAKTEHLGIAADTEDGLISNLSQAFEAEYDVLITSGGVSKGRYDLVRQVVEKKLGGNIIFHGIAVRPGTPVLFATYEKTNRKGVKHRVAIFGAPGNPLAVASTLRFFIVPYLESLTTRAGMSSFVIPNIGKTGTIDYEGGNSAAAMPESSSRIAVRTKPKNMTVFWLASKWEGDSGRVDIVKDQASYKLKGLLSADCWIIVPDNRTDVHQGDILTSCPL